VKNSLSLLMEKVYEAPVWVQEVIYCEIKFQLQKKLPSVDLNYKEFEIYPAFCPQITFKGKKEFEDHSLNFEPNVYKCLEAIMQNQRVIDITLNNFWTLEETSKCLVDCIDNELIYEPSDNTLCAAIYYIAGAIRIGEYVKRINKINVEQLDEVLRKQKEYNLENPDAKIKTGELMVNMGYIANMDIDKILYTKDEAKRRFIFSADVSNVQGSFSANQCLNNDIQLLEQNKKLLAENKLLKDKLRQIFNLQNKGK